MPNSPEDSGQTNRESEFLSVAEVALRWNCNAKTIRRLIGAGKLPMYRLGKQIRIGRADLLLYERANRVEAREG